LREWRMMATPIRPTDYGLVFGGSKKTTRQGRVSNIYRPSDAAVGGGARDRAGQPEGRGAGIVRPGGSGGCERGPERAGDYVEMAG
jgi:hypothetical protein